MQIRSHVPPKPYAPQDVSWEDLDRAYREQRKHVSLEDLCLQRPPPQGGSIGTEVLTMNIVDTIRTGTKYHAQLVKVVVGGVAENQEIVAKFYDPLYSDPDDGYYDTFVRVDESYRSETAAYVHLKHLQGTTVPRYYGSYTCDLPFNGAQRTVRLILMEFINGVSMRASEREIKTLLPQETRKNIMRRVVEANIAVRAGGVYHRDWETRNVMLATVDASLFDSPDLRVVVIDFESALVPEDVDTVFKNVSPILRWEDGGSCMWPFSTWIDWDWEPWTMSIWDGDPRFAPITREIIEWNTCWTKWDHFEKLLLPSSNKALGKALQHDEPSSSGVSYPYSGVTELHIRSHEPPKPRELDGWVADSKYAKEYQREKELTSLQQLCIKRTPATCGSIGDATPSLKILDSIRTGIGQAAQIAKVVVAGIADGFPICAKFYDPYLWGLGDCDSDPFRDVDGMYGRETAAYIKLSALYGTVIPRYYGSFTCDLPLDGGFRSVRLILMEYVEGVSMGSFDFEGGDELPQSTRQNIMMKVIEAESAISAEGVNHNDLAPRNVLLGSSDPDELQSSALRVAIIDFGIASFGYYGPQYDKPVSPILRWNRNSRLRGNFGAYGWIDWDWPSWTENVWAGSPMYAPITDELRRYWIYRIPVSLLVERKEESPNPSLSPPKSEPCGHKASSPEDGSVSEITATTVSTTEEGATLEPGKSQGHVPKNNPPQQVPAAAFSDKEQTEALGEPGEHNPTP